MRGYDGERVLRLAESEHRLRLSAVAAAFGKINGQKPGPTLNTNTQKRDLRGFYDRVGQLCLRSFLMRL